MWLLRKHCLCFIRQNLKIGLIQVLFSLAVLGSHSPIIQIHRHIHSGYSVAILTVWLAPLHLAGGLCEALMTKPWAYKTTALALSRPHCCLRSHCVLAWIASVPVHELWTINIAASQCTGTCSNICPLLIGRGLSQRSLSPMASFFRGKLSTMKGFTVCNGVGHQASHNTAKQEKPSGDTLSPCACFSCQHWTTYHTQPTENGLQRHSYLTSETCEGIILSDKQGYARVIK